VVNSLSKENCVHKLATKKNAAAKRDSRKLFQLFALNGRGEWIRTSDLTVPNYEARKNVSFCL
jgi:hypothetical protein